jgi:hypothetical protein
MYIIKIKDVENNLIAECRVGAPPNADDVKCYGDYWHQIDEVPLKETRDSRPYRMLRCIPNGDD